MSGHVSRRDRSWAALRALPAEVIVETLGARNQGESSYLCPRWPGCCALFDVFEDPTYGISVRCTRPGCILDAWSWAEWALALHQNISIEEARRRLLGTAGVRQEQERRARTTKAAQRVDAFLARKSS